MGGDPLSRTDTFGGSIYGENGIVTNFGSVEPRGTDDRAAISLRILWRRDASLGVDTDTETPEKGSPAASRMTPETEPVCDSVRLRSVTSSPGASSTPSRIAGAAVCICSSRRSA